MKHSIKKENNFEKKNKKRRRRKKCVCVGLTGIREMEFSFPKCVMADCFSKGHVINHNYSGPSFFLSVCFN